MRKGALILVAVIAFTLAFEPALHTHPLGHDQAGVYTLNGATSVPCTVCAAFTVHPALTYAAVAEPLSVAAQVIPPAAAAVIEISKRPRASRAPPSA